MSEVNYDMVIPHYKDEVNLSMLLHDLCEYNKKYKPRLINIINDGEPSEDFVTVVTEYSKILPIKCYSDEHSGHVKLLNNFILSSDAKSLVVSHSDVRLNPNNANVQHVDSPSVLGYYMSTNRDVSGIGCFTLSNGRNIVEQVSASDAYITGGARFDTDRGLKSEKFGFKASFPLRDSFESWTRCLSVEDKFFAINVDFFKEIGGFEESFHEYYFYLDDYFANCRKNMGRHVVFTNETAVVHHLKTENERPDGSYVLKGDQKKLFNKFCGKWMASKSMRRESLRNDSEVNERTVIKTR